MTLADEVYPGILLRLRRETQCRYAVSLNVPQRPLSRQRCVSPGVDAREPLSFVVMHSAVAAVGQSLPKKHHQRPNVSESFWGVEQWMRHGL